MKRLSLATLLLAFLSPGLALAVSTPQTFQQFADQIVTVIGSATVDLITLAIVVYLWGAASNLFHGEEGRKRLRTQLLWGVFVIFLAVSIWGVVQLLQSSVFGSGDVTNGAGGGGGGSGSVTTVCTSLNCSSPFSNP